MSFSQWNSWHAPPPLQIGWGGGGGVNNFRKVFAEWWVGGGGEGWVGRNFHIGGGHIVLKLKLKLHNTSIKSIFGIANLIYISDIWKMHLFWKNYLFQWRYVASVWNTLLFFPVELFWSNLHLMLPPIPFIWNPQVWIFFFSSILGIETFFWKVLNFFV